MRPSTGLPAQDATADLAKAKAVNEDLIRQLQAASEALAAAAPATAGSTARGATAAMWTSDAAKRLFDEIERLLGNIPIDDETIQRAARLVTAEHSWREGLGVLLTEADAATLLGLAVDEVDALQNAGEVIALVDRSGRRSYPAYQFQNGAPSPSLAHAHRLLVESGSLSEWSAASWVRTPHPELDRHSPAQWTAEGRDEDRLLVVAGRDASRLEH